MHKPRNPADYIRELTVTIGDLSQSEEKLTYFLADLQKEMPGLFPKKLAEMTLTEQIRFARHFIDWNQRLIAFANTPKPIPQGFGPPPQQPLPPDEWKIKFDQLQKRIGNYKSTLEENSKHAFDDTPSEFKLDALREVLKYMDELRTPPPASPKQ